MYPGLSASVVRLLKSRHEPTAKHLVTYGVLSVEENIGYG